MANAPPDILEPMVVVGMACRLPGEASSPSKLWQLLENHQSTQSDFPANRVSIDAWYHPDSHRPGSISTRGGYFLGHGDSYRNFDPSFFGINPLEAASMDPQQRKLLEVVYESFESAGARLEDISGSNTACFIGNFTSDASQMHARDPEFGAPYEMTGGGLTILSNRVNYVFNLKGPSFTVDTACSSTMYALHLACRSLAAGDCSAAVVGGANLIFGIEQQMGSVKLGVLSPTSTCHTFDESADGYSRAEAVGSLYVKRLSDAIANGDPIRAVIRGTAINANGKSPGISHPSALDQEKVIRKAYSNAILGFEETGYFECHGTGTPVGDPLEVSAIGSVFSVVRTAEEPLLIGSVKTTLGHGEAASAIPSLIKVILSLEKRLIPATIGIKTFNPALNFRDGRLKVVQSLTPWPRDYRRASVNSFGYGGANAHAIIDAAESYFNSNWTSINHLQPKYICAAASSTSKLSQKSRKRTNGIANTRSESGSRYLLAFSANSPQALQTNIKAISETADEYPVLDLAYTLGQRRSRLPSRAFSVVSEKEISSQLSEESIYTGEIRSRVPTLAFIFTGQGAQWPQMGLTLLRTYPSVMQTFLGLDNVLAGLPNPPTWTLLEELEKPKATSMINEAIISQPLCTAIQIAIVDLLSLWNIRPKAVVGHSSGEIAAAYAARFLTSAQAIIIAYQRGVSASLKNSPGAMLAVGVGAESVTTFIDDIDGVTIACHNSPQSVTLSGTEQGIDAARAILSRAGIFNRKLITSGNAYHSALMKPAGEHYEQKLHQLLQSNDATEGGNLDIAMFSSVTGKSVYSNEVTLKYWRQNLESPVLFNQAAQKLFTEVSEVDHVIEIGPHPALGGPLKDIRAAINYSPERLVSLPTLKRGGNGVENVLHLVGTLFISGYPVDIGQLNAKESIGEKDGKAISVVRSEGNLIIDLPTYQWAYDDIQWQESRLSTDLRFRKYPRHDLLGSKILGASDGSPSWRNIIELKDVPWLQDHKVGHDVVFPAAGYLVMAVEAARQTVAVPFDTRANYHLQGVSISAAMVLREESGTEISFDLQKSAGSELFFHFSVSSVSSGKWTKHASGGIEVDFACMTNKSTPLAYKGSRGGVNKHSNDRRWYESLAKCGLVYGKSFNALSDIRSNPVHSEATADITLDLTKNMMSMESSYIIHPTTIDACLQLAIIAAHDGKPETMIKPYLPVSIPRLLISSFKDIRVPEILAIHGHGARKGLRTIDTSAELSTLDGQILLEMKTTFFSLENSMGQEQYQPPQTYTRLVWKPDFDRLSIEQIDHFFALEYNDKMTQAYSKLEELTELSILDLADYLTTEKTCTTVPVHLQKFVSWVKSQSLSLRAECQSVDSATERQQRIKTIVHEIGASVPEALTIQKLHSTLQRILSGSFETQAGDSEEGLATRIPSEGLIFATVYDQLEKVMELIAHKDPALRILEIGASNGAATKRMLHALRANTPLPQYVEYHFTDQSIDALESAKNKFDGCRNMVYSVFDIEKEATLQGFAEGSFDIILASNTFNSTHDMSASLENCNKLLRPNGKLIIIERTSHSLTMEFMLGYTSGYSSGGRDRKEQPQVLPKTSWSELFCATGFSGIDVVLKGSQDPKDCMTLMVSRSLNKLTNGHTNGISTEKAPIWLVIRNEAHPLLEEIEKLYARKQMPTRRTTLEDFPLVAEKGARTILLVELESPLLSRMSDSEWAAFQAYTELATTSVWVTNAGVLTGEDPEKTLVFGLAKSIMTEQPSFHLASIDIDTEAIDYERSAKLVVETELKFHQDPTSEMDTELVEKNSVVYLSRYLTDEKESANFERNFKAKPEKNPIRDNLTLDFEKIGDIGSHFFRDNSAERQSGLGETEVIVHVKSYGLDKSFTGILRGQKTHSCFSLEAAGVIKEVGANVSNFQPGDRVICLQPTRFDTSITVDGSLCLPVLDSENFSDLTSQIFSFSTAFHILHRVCHVQTGEEILVDLPGDVLNLAVVQMAVLQGASVTAVCASEEERLLLRAHGALRVLDSQSGDISPDFQDFKETPFAVILSNGVSGWLKKSPEIITSGGSLLVISYSTPTSFALIAPDLFARGVSITCFSSIEAAVSEQMRNTETLKKVLVLLRAGSVKPIPSKAFNIAHLTEAIAFVDTPDYHGRITLATDEPSTIVPIHSPPQRLELDGNSEYLLVGCLGGLGRSLTTWMIARGARKFIFLSRTGADKPAAAALIEELCETSRREGLCLSIQVVRGDVTKREDVARAIGSATRPIKGVIQASMVLKDILFSTMSLQGHWNPVLHPKVFGTIHLHDLLRDQDLDFFVMTSSVLGAIGAATQSNYSAANAYLDHMARHRHNLGLQATSIALGMILDVGHVEEHPDVEKALKRNGIYGISVAEYLLMMEFACTRRDPSNSPWNYDPCVSSHIVTGMDPTRLSRAGGKGLWLRDNRLRQIVLGIGAGSDDKTASSSESNTDAILKSAAKEGGDEAVRAKTRDLLVERFSKFILLPVSKVDVMKPLAFYGMDSMIGAELRNWSWKEFRADVPFLALLDQNLTITGLADKLFQSLDMDSIAL
ncbi:hypothetical protein DL95DRAFT_467116 [Leptodontidium sp. 2 PMI_412]|nr:hypothetical protein DL95DRAFT_467116 [Leptodontidium sp. 2 PMI_412]